MYKRYLIVLLLQCLIWCLSISFANAQHGTVIETGVVKSKLLKKDVQYSVYLPYDYNVSQRSYPVFYLLHGHGDDETGWIQLGEIAHYADESIATGNATPMVIVMPDGFKSYYINSYDSAVLYEDFFFNELMPYVEKQYRIRAGRKFRAVGGLSMGGYGAFLYAIKHPEVFSCATPLSAAIRTDDEMVAMKDEQYNTTHGPLYGRGLKGASRLTQTWYTNSVIHQIAVRPLDSLKSIRWYIDCGDEDYLSTGNVQVHLAMKKRGVPHEFRMRDGSHNWIYWRTALPDVLHFISEGFH